MEARINQTRQVAGHVEYCIELKHAESQLGWAVWRRYSTFSAVQQGLRRGGSTASPIPKKTMALHATSPQVSDKRAASLETWLNEQLSSPDTMGHEAILELISFKQAMQQAQQAQQARQQQVQQQVQEQQAQLAQQEEALAYTPSSTTGSSAAAATSTLTVLDSVSTPSTPPPSAISGGATAIGAWLEGVKPGFDKFVAAFQNMGIDDLDDLVESNETEIVKVINGLAACGAKPLHERRVRQAIAEARGTEDRHGVAVAAALIASLNLDFGSAITKYFSSCDNLGWDDRSSHARNTKLGEMFGEIIADVLPNKLELLRRTEEGSVERCYVLINLACYVDYAMTNHAAEETCAKKMGVAKLIDLLEQIGGREAICGALCTPQHVHAYRREGEQDMFTLWMLGGAGSVLLHLGEIRTIARYIDGRVEAQESFLERRRKGEILDVELQGLWYLWSGLGRCLMRHGLLGLAKRVVVEVLGIQKWSDVVKFFDDAWTHLSGIHGKQRVGTMEHNWNCFAMEMIALGCPDSEFDKGAFKHSGGNTARKIGKDAGGESYSEVLTRISKDVDGHYSSDHDCYLNRSWGHYSSAEAAMLACQRHGYDKQVDKYAWKVLHEFIHHTTLRCSARLALAAIHRKKGDERKALEHFKAAAADATKHMKPILLVRIGRECGGADGQKMIDEGIASTGRPAEEVVAEYDMWSECSPWSEPQEVM